MIRNTLHWATELTLVLTAAPLVGQTDSAPIDDQIESAQERLATYLEELRGGRAFRGVSAAIQFNTDNGRSIGRAPHALLVDLVQSVLADSDDPTNCAEEFPHIP